MKDHMHAQRENQSGFTLLEMSITVALIGLILAFSVPSFLRAREKTKRESAKAELEMLSNAILKLVWDTGRWPNTYLRTTSQANDVEVWDLNASSTGLRTANLSTYPGWKGPYIDNIPIDPWGMPYFFDPDYTVKIGGVNKTVVVVGSFGPNRSGRNLYDSDDIYVILKK